MYLSLCYSVLESIHAFYLKMYIPYRTDAVQSSKTGFLQKGKSILFHADYYLHLQTVSSQFILTQVSLCFVLQ